MEVGGRGGGGEEKVVSKCHDDWIWWSGTGWQGQRQCGVEQGKMGGDEEAISGRAAGEEVMVMKGFAGTTVDIAECRGSEWMSWEACRW